MTLALLTEAHVDALFSREDAEDGRALLARVPVRVLRAETGREFSSALVSVGVLNVGVEMHAAGGVDLWCAHDGTRPCAHGAAAVLALAEGDTPFGVGAVGRGSVGPARTPRGEPWERALRRLLPPGDDADPVGELALLFDVRESAAGDPPGAGVAIRPAVRGSTGRWVRTGIGWRAVADSEDQDPRWRALADIAALYDGRHAFAAAGERIRRGSRTGTFGAGGWGAPDWIRLDAVPSRGLWEALSACHDAGVEFACDDSAQTPVAVSDAARDAAIDLRMVSGRLRVEAVAPGEEGERILPIGAPTAATAIVSGSAVASIAPLARPASAEWDRLLGQGHLSVPEARIDDFRRDYLPHLRGVAPLTSSDDSFELPPPALPELVLALRHVDHAVRMYWEWEYPEGERRDRVSERELLHDIDLAAGRFRHLLGRARGSDAFPARDLDRDETVEFLAHVLPALREVKRLRVESHDEVPTLEMATEDPVIEIGADPTGEDWFELKVVVTIQGEPVSSGALLTALSRGQTYFRLLSGTVFPLTDARFAKLRDVLAEAQALHDFPPDHPVLPRSQVDLWRELAALGVLEAQHAAWVDALAALDEDGVERREPPAGFGATLRDYQLTGFSWLDFLRRGRLGGVLADDMGLGKTVQLLAALEQARLDEPDARFLVVAPTSVVGHWVAEAARFAPGLRTRAITETTTKRGASLAAAAGDAQLLVTSYTILRLGADEFRERGFRVVVLDEAQNVKNSSSHSHAAVRRLGAPTTFVVTGTPLENNLMELFALVALAAPGLFGTRENFRERFARSIEKFGNAAQLETLRARIRPFLLRRTKEQVAPELPAKSEQVLEVPLHGPHQRAYERRFRREQQKLLGLLDDVNKNRIQILASLTRLRREALDPSFGDAADNVRARSAKLDALGELLDEIVADGHRALVFSQFTDFLGLAAGVADRRGIRYSYLDGRTSAAQRTRMVERFQTGRDPAFFISLKAGGTGLNLTAADYCILLDPWWNPAAEEQAIDRTHRIGQDKPVMVYRIIAAGTIEQKVRELQEKKRRLFHSVLDDAEMPTFTSDDFRALLG